LFIKMKGNFQDWIHSIYTPPQGNLLIKRVLFIEQGAFFDE